ncbi:hypothetical protein KAU92_03750 [Candidatus Bathyarchaeota archaeon]|nr:hypothetical protein [Candidatus Bathyarchaeota archaeon]
MRTTRFVALVILVLIAVVNVMSVQAAIAQGVFKEAHIWVGKGGRRTPFVLGGTVTIAIEGENLVVTYKSYGAWEFTETHLYVGITPPSKSSPGRFPYGHDNLGGVATDTYTIPLAELGVECGDTLYFAVHAVVRMWTDECWLEETGWAGILCGVPFRHGWGAYFYATIPCSDL